MATTKASPKKKTKTAAAKKTAVKKPTAKKAAVKKTTTKKVLPKKTASKKTVTKKTSTPKSPVKKTAAKKSAQKKTTVKKQSKADTPVKTTKAVASMRKTLQKSLPQNGKTKKLLAKDRRLLEKSLRELRDSVVDEINFLAGESLNRSQKDAAGDLSSYSLHMADQGTDNFNREFALNLVSSEQDVLYEIDEALQRLQANTYGICEACGVRIRKARLEAKPFARMCIKCKSEEEAQMGRGR